MWAGTTWTKSHPSYSWKARVRSFIPKHSLTLQPCCLLSLLVFTLLTSKLETVL